MVEVKQLMETFIRLEKEIHELFLYEKIDEHNNLVDEINNLTQDPEPPHTFNLASKITLPLSMIEKLVIDNTEIKIAKPRDLFKITEYENPEYGKLWACYVSVANPITDNVKTIDNCFIVAKVDGELKMISLFFYDGMDDFMWKHGGGIELNLYELGKVVAVERLLTPLKDEWSLEEYKLDR
jgi:hypothetical protein